MFIQRLVVPVVLAASGVVVLGVGSAEATTALRTDPGGALLSGATTIRNTTSDRATLTTSLGTLTCAQTAISGTATTNTSATTISGVGQMTFTSCTDTIAPINITSCRGHGSSPKASTVTATAGGGTVTISDALARCSIQNSTNACYYTAATAFGSVNNAASSISFPAVSAATVQPTTDALAPGLCGAASTFSVTVTHGVNQANQTLTVTTF